MLAPVDVRLTSLSLQVRFNNDQQSALVQFSSVAEAQKAFESSDAVCGNRFVKVFYFKVQEGGPGRRRGREEILDVTVSWWRRGVVRTCVSKFGMT